MPTRHSPTKPVRSNSTEQSVVNEHLAELRGRIRLLTWISGFFWTALALFGGLLVTGILDWLLHFDDSGTRLVLGLGLVAISATMLWRQLIAPLRIPLSSSFLASRVEKRFPGLKNRLLSAVEFLDHRLDSRLGSTELQRAVVGQALDDLQQIEPSDVIEARAVRNITIAGSMVCALAALVVMLHPAEAATSVRRLMFPFSNVPWPRNVELKLVQSDLSPVVLTPDRPTLIARGDTLELYVENSRGRLPEKVWFEYRWDDEETVIREALRQTTLRDEQGHSHEVAMINWVATRGKIFFRATGGDDNVMPFHQVDVVPPPTIEALQLTVTPPAYSRQPRQVLPAGVGHVQGLLGTQVEITARSDKPLQSARLRMGEGPGIPLTILENEREFLARFEIKEAATINYWFELTDTQGFTDREAIRYELRGIADAVPDVVIESPVTDVLLTAEAQLPVDILAKDDLGLRQVRITFQIGDEDQLRTIPIFDRAADQVGDPVETQPEAPLTGPQRQQASYLWKMAELDLEPGTRIVFRAEATDDYDLGEPHLGKSIPRTITIVSREEKQKEMASRVGDLLDDLKQATELQKRARQLTQDLQTQLDQVGDLRPKDLDQLQRAELDQRQTTSRLSHPGDGVQTQASQLIEEFRTNGLTDEGTQSRLERLANELGRLQREELPNAEQALSQAQKIAEEFAGKPVTERKNPSDPSSSGSRNDKSIPAGKPNGDSQKPESGGEPSNEEQHSSATDSKGEPASASPDQKSLRSMLSQAQSEQSRSLESLTELQELLSEWRDRRDISRDLNSVIAEQEKLQQDVEQMTGQTMSKPSAELSPQESAELNKLADRQRRVAEQLDQFRKQLDKTADSLQKNDPETAERLNDVEQELNQQETVSRLNQASDDIKQNKMGAAAKSQQEAMESLQEIERMMKRQPNADTEQFLKQTEEALQEFQQLREEQQQLADQLQDLNQLDDSLEKKQKKEELLQKQDELEERMAKAERKLERLRLRGAADAAHRARKRINEMMKNVQEADDGEEMQQAMDEALDDLDQVERELVLEKRIAQERLAFEQLEKMEERLKGLRARQEEVIAETVRLEEARRENETLSRGQLKTLKDLAETERSLRHEAEQMAQQMASAEVFALVLKRLGRSMKLASEGLSERQTSEAIQTLERDAIRKIDSLLDVLKQEQNKPDPQQKPEEKPEELATEPEEQEEKPEQAQPPGDMLPQLAQIKLLKSLQEDYLERTQMLNKFRDQNGKLPESMADEISELAREQAELADFARNLITKFLEKQPESQAPKQGEDQKKERQKDQSVEKIDP